MLGQTDGAYGKVLTTELIREPQSLLPYCSWLVDEDGRQTIETVAAGNFQRRFIPMSAGIPLQGTGAVWLRLILVKSPPTAAMGAPLGSKSRLVMNLGKLPPGETRIFFSELPGPVAGSGAWHSEEAASYEDIPLPEPGSLPVSVYIRMDEMPGLWFAPMVSAQSLRIPDARPPEFLLPGLLIAAGIVCLLRSLAEKTAWAFWAALFVGCLLLQSVLPLPGVMQLASYENLPALLAPGLALILLPHVGRCMFAQPELSSLEKSLLFFLSFLGIILALAPLIPGMRWVIRLFPLWPLLLGPLLPLSLGFLAAKRPGALSYSALCVLALLGSCFALYGIKDPGLHPLLSQGGLWGLAVGGVILSLARTSKKAKQEEEKKQERPAGPGAAASAIRSMAGSAKKLASLIGLFGNALSKFSARGRTALATKKEGQATGIAPPQPTANLSPDDQDFLHIFEHTDAGSAQPGHARASGEELSAPWPPAPLPEHLSARQAPPLADAFPEPPPAGASLQEDQSMAKPEHTEPGVTVAQNEETAADAEQRARPLPQTPRPGAEQWLSSLLPDFAGKSDSFIPPPSTEEVRVISLVEENFSYADSPSLDIMEEMQTRPHRASSPASDESFVFNLHALVREVHDVVAPLAKNRGLLFSWFTAPSLPSLLVGDAPRLRGALILLLQNAVQATHQGSVQLAVRKNPGSSALGDLLFCISDNGSAQRTDAGFFHAWELAARTGGSFTVEYSQANGTQVAFTVRFALPSEEMAEAHFARSAVEDVFLTEENNEDALIPVLHAIASSASPAELRREEISAEEKTPPVSSLVAPSSAVPSEDTEGAPSVDEDARPVNEPAPAEEPAELASAPLNVEEDAGRRSSIWSSPAPEATPAPAPVCDIPAPACQDEAVISPSNIIYVVDPLAGLEPKTPSPQDAPEPEEVAPEDAPTLLAEEQGSFSPSSLLEQDSVHEQEPLEAEQLQSPSPELAGEYSEDALTGTPPGEQSEDAFIEAAVEEMNLSSAGGGEALEEAVIAADLEEPAIVDEAEAADDPAGPAPDPAPDGRQAPEETKQSAPHTATRAKERGLSIKLVLTDPGMRQAQENGATLDFPGQDSGQDSAKEVEPSVIETLQPPCKDSPANSCGEIAADGLCPPLSGNAQSESALDASELQTVSLTQEKNDDAAHENISEHSEVASSEALTPEEPLPSAFAPAPDLAPEPAAELLCEPAPESAPESEPAPAREQTPEADQAQTEAEVPETEPHEEKSLAPEDAAANVPDAPADAETAMTAAAAPVEEKALMEEKALPATVIQGPNLHLSVADSRQSAQDKALTEKNLQGEAAPDGTSQLRPPLPEPARDALAPAISPQAPATSPLAASFLAALGPTRFTMSELKSTAASPPSAPAAVSAADALPERPAPAFTNAVPLAHPKTAAAPSQTAPPPFTAATAPLPSFDPADLEKPYIIVAETTTSNRRLMAHYLSGLPHVHRDALTNAEVLEIFHNAAVSLIIFDGDMPEKELLATIRTLRREEERQQRPATPILCLSSHKTQSQRMIDAGASHALCKPFSKDSFFSSVIIAASVSASFSLAFSAPPGLHIPPNLMVAPSVQPLLEPLFAVREAPPHAPEPLPENRDTPAQPVELPEEQAPAAPPQALEKQATPAPAPLAQPDGVDTGTRDRKFLETVFMDLPASSSLKNTHEGTRFPASETGRNFMLPAAKPAQLSPAAPMPEWKEPKTPAGETELFPLPPAAAARRKPWGDFSPEKLKQEEEDPIRPRNAAREPADAFAKEDPSLAGYRPKRNMPTGKTVALPGLEEEILDIAVLPLVPGLSHSLENSFKDILIGRSQHKSILVQEAAGRLAGRAETFGLRRLAKVAHCVQRAAEADDGEAIKALVDDLEPLMQRYLNGLHEVFDSFLDHKR